MLSIRVEVLPVRLTLLPFCDSGGIANSSFQTETDTYLAIICFIPFLKVPILLHSLAAAGLTAYIPAPQLPGHHHSFWNSS